MNVNRTIVVATVLIVAAGAYNVIVVQKNHARTTITRIIVGGYMLAILTAVIDLLTGGRSTPVTGGLLMVAVGTIILTILPDLLGRLGTHNANTNPTGGGGSPTVR